MSLNELVSNYLAASKATVGTLNERWSVLFSTRGFQDGSFNERMIDWLRDEILRSQTWPLAGAHLDLDFSAGRYAIDGVLQSEEQVKDALGFSRLQEAIKADPDGVYDIFGSDAFRRHVDGLITEPSSTNFCGNFNYAPTDTSGWSIGGSDSGNAVWTVTDETDRLRAAGYGRLIDSGEMNGMVFDLDNSAASAATYVYCDSGATSTGEHTLQIVGRRYSADDSVYLMGTAGFTGQAAFNSTDFETVSLTGNVPDISSSHRLQVHVAAGDRAQFILNHMQAGSIGTTPIKVSGSLASRYGESLGAPLAGKGNTSSGMLAWTGRLIGQDYPFKTIAMLVSDTDNWLGFYWPSGGAGKARLQGRVEGETALLLDRSVSPDKDVETTLAMRWNGDKVEAYFSGHDVASITLAHPMPLDMDRLAIGKHAVVTGDNALVTKQTTFTLGEQSDTDFGALIGRHDDRTIVCWGDSFTAGEGTTSAENKWVAALGTGYSPSRATVNKGIGGETSTEIRARFEDAPLLHWLKTIICAGRNNYFDPDTVIEDVVAMVDRLPHRNYLIIGVPNADYNGEQVGGSNHGVITGLNQALADMFGERYLDIREGLVNAYDHTDVGDLADFANDIPPGSLRSDLAHFNDAGQAVWRTLIRKKLDALGW